MRKVKLNDKLYITIIHSGITLSLVGTLTLGLVGCNKASNVENPDVSKKPVAEQTLKTPTEEIANPNKPLAMVNLPLLNLKNSNINQQNYESSASSILELINPYVTNENIPVDAQNFLIVRDYITQLDWLGEEEPEIVNSAFDLACILAAADIVDDNTLSPFWLELQPSQEHQEAFIKLVKEPIEIAIATNNYEQIMDLSNQCANMEQKSQFSCLAQSLYDGLVTAKKEVLDEQIVNNVYANTSQISNNFYLSGNYKDSVFYQKSELTR